MRHPKMLCSVVCLVAGLLPSLSIAQQAASTHTELFPSGAIAYLEVTGLDEAVTAFEKSELLAAVNALPQVAAYYESDDYRKVVAGRKLASRVLQKDAVEFVKELLGHRLSVAIYPHEGRARPDALLVLEPRNGEVISDVWDLVEPALTLIGQESRIEADENGWYLVRATPELSVGYSSKVIVLSSSDELMSRFRTLNNGSDSAGNSLADSSQFMNSWQRLDTGALARVWLDLEQVRATNANIPQKLDNALASLLFGHALFLGKDSPDLTASLSADSERLHLRVLGHLEQESLAKPWDSFFSNPQSGGAPAIPQIPGLIAGFTVYRNFDAWYRGRETLMTPETLPEFDKFETGLANLLPGRDFGEDVLPLIGDSMTILAASQSYDHLAGEPGIKFPGIAVIFEMEDVEQASGLFNLFFQTLSAILNIQAGQQGRQPWVMSSESYNDIQLNFGRYLSKPEGEELPFVFNFMPAAAQVGNHYVLSSSLDVCRRIVDELQAGKTGDRENRNFELKFLGQPLIEAIRSNQRFFVAQGVKDGKSLEQAQSELDLALDFASRIQSLEFWTQVTKETFEVNLRGTWK